MSDELTPGVSPQPSPEDSSFEELPFEELPLAELGVEELESRLRLAAQSAVNIRVVITIGVSW